MLNLGFKTRLGLKHSKTLAVACRHNRTTAATRNNLCLSGCCAYPVADFNYDFLHLPSFSIFFHHVPSFSTIFHNFPSFSIIFHIFFIMFHHFPQFSIIFHHFPSFSIIFHHFPPNNSDDPISAMDGLKPPFSTRAETSTALVSQAMEGLAAVLKEAGGAI